MKSQSVLNLIMFITMYPSLFLLYFCMHCAGKSSGGMLFGIRYSGEWLPDGEVRGMERDFSRRLKKCLLLFLAIPFGTLFVPYVSVCITVWLVWLFAAIAVFSLQCSWGFRRMLRLKEERVMPAEEYARCCELKGMRVRCLKWYDCAAPAILNCLMAALPFVCFTEEKRSLYGIFAVVTAVSNLSLCACALWMERLRVRVISQNSDVNANYARAVKRLWKQFWVASFWIATLYMAILLLFLYMETMETKVFYAIPGGSTGICLLMLGLCIRLVWRRRKLEESYRDKMDSVAEHAEADEKYWIGGLIYYNPGDPHTMVSRRFGIGTTVNLARPGGKAFVAVGGLALLVSLGLCVWLMLEEFTPFSLSVRDGILEARHLRTEYALPLESIESVALVEELPRLSRIYGTNSSTLYKGVFRNSEDGRVRVFLNPENEIFLRIDAGDSVYYMGGYDDGETKEIYNCLKR